MATISFIALSLSSADIAANAEIPRLYFRHSTSGTPYSVHSVHDAGTVGMARMGTVVRTSQAQIQAASPARYFVHFCFSSFMGVC
ncbi:hypothetical protein K474DRAFT_1658625 [Panus rudis PR-1116 ss-1]|nr:hypothetical protein K474DRAFT_1658625 [Panus rudis PR-1116 ss-1]